jgi:hypothetical protein
MSANTILLTLLLACASASCNTTTMGSPIAGRRPQSPDRSEIEWTPLRVEDGELVVDYLSVEGRGTAQIRSVLLRFESARGELRSETVGNEEGKSSFVLIGRTRVQQETGLRVYALIRYMSGEEARIQLR